MALAEDALKLPSDPGREDPIYKAPTAPPKAIQDGAIFIFVHGLADSAAAIQDVADQIQRANRLPHLAWILPNAKPNRITLDTAWFTPNNLSSLAPSRPELVPEEDETGMLETVSYLETLIDACVQAGYPLHRIVLGGFSQGCAMSLLLHLTSGAYGGKLAGVAGLLGYLPLCDGTRRLHELRGRAGLSEREESGVPMLMAYGMKDPLIPRRVWRYSVQVLKDLGLVPAPEGKLDVHEYDGLTHTIHGPVLRDLCAWLEKVVPPVEPGSSNASHTA